ncbi:hypothetical protein [Anaerosporobacter faecicola]|uniref:hypothetical protein n=1 Tax=Anaerosporobacter faecicola TaxID=2718714 RepID=UPI00143C620E|nr:hypothetical protein [Anaerosporobacter faecicola]
MIHSINVQWKIMTHKMEFIFAFLVAVTYACISLLYNFNYYKDTDISKIPAADTLFCMSSYSKTWSYFEVIFPFLVILPFAISFINENRNGITPMLVYRSTHKQYFLSKAVVCFLGGFLIIMLPFLLNLVLCHIFFSNNHNVIFGEYGMPNYFRTLLGTNQGYRTTFHAKPFLDVYLVSTTLYNLLYILLLSLFSGLVGVFVLSWSYFIKKHVILLFLPFFILIRITNAMTVSSFNIASQNHEKLFLNYSIMDYFSPFSFSGQNWYYMLLLCLMMILFCLIAHVYILRRASKGILTL